MLFRSTLVGQFERYSAIPMPTLQAVQPRRFVSLARTLLPDGGHTLDAIADDGTAWWLIVGVEGAPEGWTQLHPLPDLIC